MNSLYRIIAFVALAGLTLAGCRDENEYAERSVGSERIGEEGLPEPALVPADPTTPGEDEAMGVRDRQGADEAMGERERQDRVTGQDDYQREADEARLQEQRSEREALAKGDEEARRHEERVEMIKLTFTHLSKGSFDQALENVSEDVVWIEVGSPRGDITTRNQVKQHLSDMARGFSEIVMKPSRIIDGKDYQVVEFVWSGRNTGALAEGTKATDQVATVKGAMLVHYAEKSDETGAAGSEQTANYEIDRVWVFQDWPRALQQIGLAPELPGKQTAAKLPTTVEIIELKDDGDTKFRERYTELVSKIGKEDQQAAFEKRTTGDFQWTDASSNQTLRGADKLDQFLTQSSGVFEPQSTSIDVAFGAEDTLVVLGKTETKYKGGFLNAPADDQEVELHHLDIVTIDPETGRFESLTRYSNSFEPLVALQLVGGAQQKPQDSIEPFAPAEPQPGNPTEPDKATPNNPEPAAPTQPEPGAPDQPEGNY